MKKVKMIFIISSIFFLVLSLMFYFVVFNYPIDDIEFGCIPLYLNPARVFLASSIFVFVSIFFIESKKIFNIEKIFICYVLLILATCIFAGATAWFGYSSEKSDFESSLDFQQASNDVKIFLPFHDLFFENENHYGAYYVAKTTIDGSLYMCADNCNSYADNGFYYESEYLRSSSFFLLLKFYINKICDLQLNFYDKDLKKGRTYVSEDRYVFCKFDNNYVLFISAFNPSDYNLSEKDFNVVALRQLSLFNKQE